MMVKSKNKSLLIAVLALITCCVFAIAGIGATNAAAWYEWDKHDPPIITPEQLADTAAWDANGWRTTVEAGSWTFGVAEYNEIEQTTGRTHVTLGENKAFLNRSELDITGSKAVKFTYKTAANNLWFTLATQAMFESGHRLNPTGNEAQGMPVSVWVRYGIITKRTVSPTAKRKSPVWTLRKRMTFIFMRARAATISRS